MSSRLEADITLWSRQLYWPGPGTVFWCWNGTIDPVGNGAKISIAFVEDGGELHAFYDGVLSGMDKPWGGVSWLLARNG